MRVKSISFRTDAAVKDNAPKDVHLFINKPSLGFEDVEDESAVVQTLHLTAEDVSKGTVIPLRYVKFQNVHSLHVRCPACLTLSQFDWGFSLLTHGRSSYHPMLARQIRRELTQLIFLEV